MCTLSVYCCRGLKCILLILVALGCEGTIRSVIVSVLGGGMTQIKSWMMSRVH